MEALEQAHQAGCAVMEELHQDYLAKRASKTFDPVADVATYWGRLNTWLSQVYPSLRAYEAGILRNASARSQSMRIGENVDYSGWRVTFLGKLDALQQIIGQSSAPAAIQTPPVSQPQSDESSQPGVSRPNLAQAAVIAHFLAHPDSEPTAEEIGNSVGLDAPTIRNAPAWKLHRRGKKKSADDIGDASEIGDVDEELEEMTGKQERGRDRRNLRRNQ